MAQLREKGWFDTKAVMRRLVTQAEKIGRREGIDPLAENIFKRPLKWTKQFIIRMRPQIESEFGGAVSKCRMGKPTKLPWEHIQGRIDKFREKLAKAVDEARAMPGEKEIIFINLDETPTRFSYAVEKGRCYALKHVDKDELPATDGQTEDKRSFSALCYHSTSTAFNREVLLGEGKPSWTSMTMFCMPPGDGRRREMNKTLDWLQKNFTDFPGLRPVRYENETSMLGRMDRPLFQTEMKELSKRMQEYAHKRDCDGKGRVIFFFNGSHPVDFFVAQGVHGSARKKQYI
jgi:hypothetical protein